MKVICQQSISNFKTGPMLHIRVLCTSRWCSFENWVLTSGSFYPAWVTLWWHCRSLEKSGYLSTWCFRKFPPLELVSNTLPNFYHCLEHFLLLPASVPMTKDHPTSRLGSEGLKWEVLTLKDEGGFGNKFLKAGTSFRQDTLGGSLPLHSENPHRLLPLLETLVLMKRGMSWV